MESFKEQTTIQHLTGQQTNPVHWFNRHKNSSLPSTSSSSSTSSSLSLAVSCNKEQDNIDEMPSKQVDDVLAVEELVHEIRENLRLKARPSHQQTHRSSRPSPYHIPCRSWNSDSSCDKQNNTSSSSNKKSKNSKSDDVDDPYEMLQALLKSNSLVKEAVRRLQLNISPKQRYFYDSDEETSRSPMIHMCHLEL